MLYIADDVIFQFFFSEKLHHPLSLDVFENNLFWTTRDLGEVVKQDKFGRGLPVVIVRNLINPTGVKGKFLQLFFPFIQ